MNTLVSVTVSIFLLSYHYCILLLFFFVTVWCLQEAERLDSEVSKLEAAKDTKEMGKGWLVICCGLGS